MESFLAAISLRLLHQNYIWRSFRFDSINFKEESLHFGKTSFASHVNWVPILLHVTCYLNVDQQRNRAFYSVGLHSITYSTVYINNSYLKVVLFLTHKCFIWSWKIESFIRINLKVKDVPWHLRARRIIKLLAIVKGSSLFKLLTVFGSIDHVTNANHPSESPESLWIAVGYCCKTHYYQY